MDTVTALLDTLRVRSAVYFSKILRPPWGMEVDERSGIWRFHLVLNGSTWVSLSDNSHQEHLHAGDFVIVPRGKSHLLGNRKASPITSRHNIPDLEPVTELENGIAQRDETHLLCGYFRFSQGAPLGLLDHLPGLLVARSNNSFGPGHTIDFVEAIQHELQNHDSVPLVVLNRLTEIMFYYAVRRWLEKALLPDGALAALGDRQLQRAISMIHSSPEAPWTVEALAKIAGQSRTAFSNHFRSATGFSPINYLSYWRIELACRLLTDTSLGLDEIATRVGYADTNAFSRAFSRVRGIAPGGFRKASHSQE